MPRLLKVLHRVPLVAPVVVQDHAALQVGAVRPGGGDPRQGEAGAAGQCPHHGVRQAVGQARRFGRGVALLAGEELGAHADVDQRGLQTTKPEAIYFLHRATALGPWLVTADEITDPQDLHLWLELNGQRVQNGSTANMVFGCAELVSYISRFMTLLPGDVIVTGTPPGVGLGMKPQRFLKAGDSLRLGIDGLGVQEQIVVASR